MTTKGKILTGYTTFVLVLFIIALVLGVLWFNPTILSPPTSVPVEKEKPEQYFKAIQLTSGPWNDHAPIWSPDGKKIAFESDRSGNWSIWAMNADGKNQSQLTGDDMSARWPAWSPDGKKIAFWALSSGQADIWVIDVSGGNQTRVTSDSAVEGQPHWSPDGKNILFSKKNSNWDIWVLRLERNEQVQLTQSSGNNMYPSWSPDGKRIVFASDRAGNYDIWMMNTDGSNQTRLTMDPRDEVMPCMSPNGNWTSFLIKEPKYFSLWIMTRDDQNKSKLASYLSEDSNPSWSPDGKRILFWYYMGQEGIYDPEPFEIRTDAEVLIVDIYGNVTRPTLNSTAHDMYPSWSPDGKKIALTSNRGGNYNVWVILIEFPPSKSPT